MRTMLQSHLPKERTDCMPGIAVSASRLESGHRCPRRRFLGHEYKGRGLEPVRARIPLTVGIWVHKGVERLLKGDTIEVAAAAALDGYSTEVRERGFELQPGEDAYYVAVEQQCLIEAMLWAWYLRRLPYFLARYTILDAEYQFVVPLSGGLSLRGRVDGVLREKETGDLYVLSVKTKSVWDSRAEAAGRTQMQGISETFAVEQKFGEMSCGTIMEYLLKGKREQYPAGSGQYLQSSGLVRPWSDGANYAHSYTWTDPVSGQNRRLGKGWSRVNIWDRMPVRTWIEALHNGSVQPEAGDFLSQVFVTPAPYFRSAQHIEDWKEQTVAAELRTAGLSLEHVTLADRSLLNWFYPQYPHSCEYPGPCAFKDICWGPVNDPEGSGLFRLRTEQEWPSGGEDQ